MKREHRPPYEFAVVAFAFLAFLALAVSIPLVGVMRFLSRFNPP